MHHDLTDAFAFLAYSASQRPLQRFWTTSLLYHLVEFTHRTYLQRAKDEICTPDAAARVGGGILPPPHTPHHRSSLVPTPPLHHSITHNARAETGERTDVMMI